MCHVQNVDSAVISSALTRNPGSSLSVGEGLECELLKTQNPTVHAEPYIGYPPMHMGVGWAWVRCYCSWVRMSGRRWTSVLCIPASSSKSESSFSDVGNTLTKKRSGLKPTTMNDLLFVRSNQDLV
jgi:hypothetical protein